MDDYDLLDADEFLGDESFVEHVPKQTHTKGDARRRYEKMKEEKRLRMELENDIGYW